MGNVKTLGDVIKDYLNEDDYPTLPEMLKYIRKLNRKSLPKPLINDNKQDPYTHGFNTCRIIIGVEMKKRGLL